MDDYLSKPIQPKILAQIINRIAGSAQGDHYKLVESASAESIIDWDAALELVGGSRDVLSELMEVFFEERCTRQSRKLTQRRCGGWLTPSKVPRPVLPLAPLSRRHYASKSWEKTTISAMRTRPVNCSSTSLSDLSRSWSIMPATECPPDPYFGARQRACVSDIRRSAEEGPHVPAGYNSGDDHASITGVTNRHSASNSSLRVNRVESPRITSSSSRSYASGSCSEKCSPYSKSIDTGCT